MRQSFLLILSLAVLSAFMLVDATSGSLTAYVSISSINNMMQTFVPLIAYYAINNKTINLNLHKVGVGYTLDLKKIVIEQAKGFTTKSAKFVNGNQVKVVLSGIEVDTKIDGTLYALWFIPMRASYCNITGFDLEVTLGIEQAKDKVHYTIIEASVI